MLFVDAVELKKEGQMMMAVKLDSTETGLYSKLVFELFGDFTNGKTYRIEWVGKIPKNSAVSFTTMNMFERALPKTDHYRLKFNGKTFVLRLKNFNVEDTQSLVSATSSSQISHPWRIFFTEL